jgi:hypothetical protein
MAGLAVAAVLDARFTGPQYGYHETDIVEATGVKDLEQIEGTNVVHAHHLHAVDHGRGRKCYPIEWSYAPTSKGLWFNSREKRVYSTRLEACGCAPEPGQADFRGCPGKSG